MNPYFHRVAPYRAGADSSDKLFYFNFLEFPDLILLQLRSDGHEIPEFCMQNSLAEPGLPAGCPRGDSNDYQNMLVCAYDPGPTDVDFRGETGMGQCLYI